MINIHTLSIYITSWTSGGGGGRDIFPDTPALLDPIATEADTHLKKPEKAAESIVSRVTTLSVSSSNIFCLALGPAAHPIIELKFNDFNMSYVIEKFS